MNAILDALRPLSAYLPWILLLYAVMSLITFLAYGIDKRKAKKNSWRTPEKTLIGLSFLFGAPGAVLGMRVFRHKTKHAKFRILVPLSLILHLAFLLLLVIARVS